MTDRGAGRSGGVIAGRPAGHPQAGVDRRRRRGRRVRGSRRATNATRTASTISADADRAGPGPGPRAPVQVAAASSAAAAARREVARGEGVASRLELTLRGQAPQPERHDRRRVRSGAAPRAVDVAPDHVELGASPRPWRRRTRPSSSNASRSVAGAMRPARAAARPRSRSAVQHRLGIGRGAPRRRRTARPAAHRGSGAGSSPVAGLRRPRRRSAARDSARASSSGRSVVARDPLPPQVVVRRRPVAPRADRAGRASPAGVSTVLARPRRRRVGRPRRRLCGIPPDRAQPVGSPARSAIARARASDAA